MSLLLILYMVSGSMKFKMTAAKPAICRYLYRIHTTRVSQLLLQPKCQWLAPFSESRKSMALFRILPDVTGSRVFKMAAAKPEMRVFKPA